MNPLGRREPPDWEHVERYRLTAATTPSPPTPVVLGVNWYSAFDNPIKSGGRWWIGRGDLGHIRGGHAICVKPSPITDTDSWYRFYDQGQEGACVGFALSRMMSLLNRKRYAARWLYQESQWVDEWRETPPEEGTSVRAGCRILVSKGHRRVVSSTIHPPELSEGISTYRWATTVDEIRAVLSSPTQDVVEAVPLLNSWGDSYPRTVWLPYTTLQRLLNEYGEAGLVTDR